MRYPMPKATRTKLVRLYYELVLVPGVEPRVIRSWADMLSRLLANKAGMKRKLEHTDLELPWQPLWRVLKKELHPHEQIYDSSYVLLFSLENHRDILQGGTLSTSCYTSQNSVGDIFQRPRFL